MAEYLSPGVYVEEVSYRQKTIEGVSTSTAGFVGATRFGPTGGEPELLTNYSAFEEIYGGLDPLVFAEPAGEQVNYLAQGVRSFFEEGGRRLYVARPFRSYEDADAPPPVGMNADGIATLEVNDPGSMPAGTVHIRARYPGAGGNVIVRLTAAMSRNVLGGEPRDPDDLAGTSFTPVLRGVQPFDLLWISDRTSPIQSPPGDGAYYWAERYFNTTLARHTWRFHPAGGGTALELVDPTNLNGGLTPPRNPAASGSASEPFDIVRVVTVSVEVVHPGVSNRRQLWTGLSLHPTHARALTRVFAADLDSRREQLTYPIVISTDSVLDGPVIFRILMGQARNADDAERIARRLGIATTTTTPDLSVYATLANDQLGEADKLHQFLLSGGNDGLRPTASEFQPDGGGADPGQASGLRALEQLADVSIVAAPGYSFGYQTSDDNRNNIDQITRMLISHCERMRYRIAVLDSPDRFALSEVRAFRGAIDSKHAALYYPWVTQLDPVTNARVQLPPSGSIAGIYARNDSERGVQKAPANEVVRLAISFEHLLSSAQQDVLNPEGINCLRFFEGRGYRVWGARTISSDGEWRYVNLRRYFAYLERSIELGTQWAVFESNGDKLWRNVRQTVEDFLFNEWRNDRLFGLKPDEAFFVRCDRSTMNRSDLDGGRMVCEIGVSPLRPAEFVIFRIGQWTADAAKARS